jgi:hypothetical protein
VVETTEYQYAYELATHWAARALVFLRKVLGLGPARGRPVLIRSVTTREPEWTEIDRAEQLALAEYRASFCPCGCGYLTADTTSNWETGPEFDATHITCRARAALVEAQNAEIERKRDTSAWFWSISKTEKG